MAKPKFADRYLTIGAALAAAGVLLMGSLCVSGLVNAYTLATIGIGGENYVRIVAAKDLLGDILPPPEYVIEAYLEANLIMNEKGELAAHEKRLASLHKDFNDRREYWKNSALPDDIKSELVNDSGKETDRFWTELESSFLPAADRGDKGARTGSFGALSDLYARHRAVIDDLVTKSNTFADAAQESAQTQGARIGRGLVAFYAVVLAACAAALFGLRSWLSRSVDEAARGLATLADASLMTAQATRAQGSLDANLHAIRTALIASGEPETIDGKLYFGAKLINNDVEIVDRIQSLHGGVATIFLGDLRVATNVVKADGSRATGTPLGAGPVYDKLFREGATYHGEATILGKTYITVYEPILVGAEVLGALFVGVPKAAVVTKVEPPTGVRNEVSRMRATLATMTKALEERGSAERDALELRYRATDTTRRSATKIASANHEQKVVVRALSEAMKSLAANNLAHRVDGDFPAAYVDLKVNFEHALKGLNQTVREISGQAHAIFTVSNDVSNNADELSSRAERQAASLEETAAALDEITATAQRSADSAAHARAVVSEADADAGKSALVVNEAIGAMEAISDSANKISHIVGLIDEIAFQTNLLALNAGVEAARAGDAGKGFAVVASEVRALALRSAEAAKDIKSLISTSAGQVRRGVDLVTRTGESLKRIIAQVGRLNALVVDIANGAKEQATGLSEVNTAINEMDRMTQQNAAMAEQSTQASRRLDREARQLTDLIGRFRVEGAATARKRDLAA